MKWLDWCFRSILAAVLRNRLLGGNINWSQWPVNMVLQWSNKVRNSASLTGWMALSVIEAVRFCKKLKDWEDKISVRLDWEYERSQGWLQGSCWMQLKSWVSIYREEGGICNRLWEGRSLKMFVDIQVGIWSKLGVQGWMYKFGSLSQTGGI